MSWDNVVLVCCLSLLTETVLAQPRSPLSPINAKGKEFYLTFPPNQFGGLLALYIIADVPTQGEVVFGNSERKSFSITDPTIPAVLEFPSLNHDLSIAERPVVRAFYIKANDDISIYAANIADHSSDAFMVMPVRSLGLEYVVASYKSQGFFFDSTFSNFRQPSQFAITAAFDSTQIIIRPSAPTSISLTSNTQRVLLQRGESYLVQARMYSEDRERSDLSGSRIISSKPIFAIGSHMRACIPTEPSASLDCLHEQLPPIATLGTNAIILPSPFYSSSSERKDRYRIIAAFDNTIVLRNGMEVAKLLEGQMYEDSVTLDAVFISADKPILAVGYRRSQDLGDPFMVIFPPISQYLQAYRFCTIHGTQRLDGPGNPRGPAFERHFASVTIPTRYIPSLRLNSAPLTNALFRSVTTSSYSFALIEIPSGTYTLTADTTFCAIISGYGDANSYGYTAGHGFVQDNVSPRITVNRDACGRLLGTIYDSSLTDSKLFWVNDSARQNVRVDFSAFPHPADSVPFRAELQNPLQDGSVIITAIDSVNRLTRQKIFIPGFTVQSPLNTTLGSPQFVPHTSSTITLPTGIQRCFTVPLINYGSTQQTYTVLPFGANSPFRSATSMMTLRPQSSTMLTVCVETAHEGVFTDTLRLSNGCFQRDIVSFLVQAAPDTNAPIIQRQTPAVCNHVNFRLSDSGRVASGIQRITIDTLINCVALPHNMNSNGTINQIFEILSLRRDAIISFRVQDSVGNVRRLSDTIQALSVEFITTSGSITLNNGQTVLRLYSFPATVIGNVTCQTLSLYNTSSKPFRLAANEIQLNNNIIISLPPAQFPLTIPAKTMYPITLCFAPLQPTQIRDTLIISRSCIEEGIIAIGAGINNVYQGNSRCSVDVILTQQNNNRQHLITGLNTHPIYDVVTVNILLKQPSTVLLSLYTSLGTTVFSKQSYVNEGEEHPLEIDTSLLVAGIYFCEVRTNEVRQTIMLRVTR